MVSKQRFLTALNRKQPDKVPIFEALIDEPIIIAIVNILGLDPRGTQSAEKMMWGQEGLEALDRYCLLVKELGLDATSYSFSKGLEPIGDDYVRDRYDKVYRLSPYGEATIIEGPIKEPSDVIVRHGKQAQAWRFLEDAVHRRENRKRQSPYHRTQRSVQDQLAATRRDGSSPDKDFVFRQMAIA